MAISPKQFKSNQVEIWSSTGDHVVLIQKSKIRSQGSGAWVTWPAFEFWDSPIISGTSEDTNLKFCTLFDRKEYYKKKWQIAQKGAWPRSRDLLFKFWDPPNISAMAKDTNLKFCTLIEGEGY